MQGELDQSQVSMQIWQYCDITISQMLYVILMYINGTNFTTSRLQNSKQLRVFIGLLFV